MWGTLKNKFAIFLFVINMLLSWYCLSWSIPRRFFLKFVLNCSIKLLRFCVQFFFYFVFFGPNLFANLHIFFDVWFRGIFLYLMFIMKKIVCVAKMVSNCRPISPSFFGRHTHSTILIGFDRFIVVRYNFNFKFRDVRILAMFFFVLVTMVGEKVLLLPIGKNTPFSAAHEWNRNIFFSLKPVLFWFWFFCSCPLNVTQFVPQRWTSHTK